MNKQETIKIVNKIFDYIDNGKEITKERVYSGHPALYFFHSENEYKKELEKYLDKEEYNKYDIYYICQRIIKFLLDKYDSHTKLSFINSYYFPINFKIENDKVYVVDISKDFDNVVGGTLISINGIDINQIIKELETITCYSTLEYLDVSICYDLKRIDILKSLPSIDSNVNKIIYQIKCEDKIKNIIFEEDKKYSGCNQSIPKNYSSEIIDNILVFHYNSCRDSEKMKEFISGINDNVKGYIIDIRNNVGGNSEIIEPLIEYLKDKVSVTLVNEKIFSSGRMAFVNLKKIGSYTIGTDISTSLNAFGNVPGGLILEEIGISVKRSSTYWYYDDKLNCKGFYKETFKEYFNNKKELLNPIILHPDEYVYMSVNDIINNNDKQLKQAIKYILNK